MAQRKPPIRREAPTDLKACAACGAVNGADRRVCWLCNERLDGMQAGIRKGPLLQQIPYRSPRETYSKTFSLSSLFLIVTMAAVGTGIFTVAPGLLVPYIAVVLATMLRSRPPPRGYDGNEVSRSWIDSIGDVFRTLAIAFLLLMLVSFGAVVALFFACIYMISAMSTQ